MTTSQPEHAYPPATAHPAVQAVQLPASAAGENNPGTELARQLDALSLSQALLDFEVANARVLDLTARLVEANQRVQRHQQDADTARSDSERLRNEAAQTRAELTAAQAETAAIRATRGYRAMERFALLRRALRG